LYAVPFDPDKLEIRGIPVPVLNDVIGPAGVAGKFDVSQTGTLIYQKTSETNQQAKTIIQWIDSAGKVEPLLSRGFYVMPHFSPDGTRIVMGVREGANQDIQVYDWQSDRTIRLTFGGGFYIAPIWSPDGKYVVFGSNVGEFFWTRSDGSSQPQQLLPSVQVPQLVGSISPDGKRLAMVKRTVSGAELWTVPLTEQDGQLKAGVPEVFLKKSAAEMTEPRFSPDGKWLAYRSNEAGGTDQVYVRPFPPPASGEGGQWVISTQGGSHPIWSVKSHDIFYASTQGLMAVSYTVNGTTFTPEKPRLWASKVTDTSDFDLSPNGKRLAVVASENIAASPKIEHDIVFLDNFFDELRRRVPIGK
jgi:Tol biopolymer transport system component